MGEGDVSGSRCGFEVEGVVTCTVVVMGGKCPYLEILVMADGR